MLFNNKPAEPSVRVANPGASVPVDFSWAGSVHWHAVGADGKWAMDRLLEYGVETGHIAQVDTATGHANINVDAAGENNIVLYPGANHAITDAIIGAALSEASAGDFLLMQNETCGQAYAAKTAKTPTTNNL